MMIVCRSSYPECKLKQGLLFDLLLPMFTADQDGLSPTSSQRTGCCDLQASLSLFSFPDFLVSGLRESLQELRLSVAHAHGWCSFSAEVPASKLTEYPWIIFNLAVQAIPFFFFLSEAGWVDLDCKGLFIYKLPDVEGYVTSGDDVWPCRTCAHSWS